MCFVGLFIALIGVSTNVLFLSAMGFLFFAALPFINTSAEVLIRTAIPNRQQGRAWGLISLLSQFGALIAYCTVGLLADFLFNPLLVEGGALASTLGQAIGVGEGRGIGLMLIISGIIFALLAVLVARSKAIRLLEKPTQTPASEFE
jgi:MFS family permease